MTTVNSIMTKTVLTAKADTPFNDVVKALIKSNIHHLPITNSNGVLRAMISATDVLGAMHEMDQFAMNYGGYSLEKRLSVKDEMTSDVISITKDTSIHDAIKIMVENKIHALPVMSNDEIEGIVTTNDILKSIHSGYLVLKSKDEDTNL